MDIYLYQGNQICVREKDFSLFTLPIGSLTFTLDSLGWVYLSSLFVITINSNRIVNRVIKKYNMEDVVKGLKLVRDKIIAASAKRDPEYAYFEPRLVAVSKIKPPELIVAAYEAGQRHFGENYVNELKEKAFDLSISEKCQDIRWHFIGHLQKNKVNKIISIPNLYIIETVDSKSIANALDNAYSKVNDSNSKLKIMVQVNTSEEEAKNGCKVEELPELVKYILDDCKELEFTGLMTIGAYGYDVSNGPNPDFLRLKKCKEDLCKDLDLDKKKVDLSMGMSTDYEHAILLGSSSVRVGTAIFGERPKKDAQ